MQETIFSEIYLLFINPKIKSLNFPWVIGTGFYTFYGLKESFTSKLKKKL